MATTPEAMKILNDLKDKGEKEIRASAKDLLKLGQNAFKGFMSDVKDAVSSEDAKALADLYVRAEARALTGDSLSAARVLGRLNLTARAMANVKRSQQIKSAIAVWDSALKIITSLASKVLSLGGAGLSDLLSVGVDMASKAVEGFVSKAAKVIDDDDVVVEDEEEEEEAEAADKPAKKKSSSKKKKKS
jgi:hypothetical protein